MRFFGAKIVNLVWLKNRFVPISSIFYGLGLSFFFEKSFNRCIICYKFELGETYA